MKKFLVIPILFVVAFTSQAQDQKSPNRIHSKRAFEQPSPAHQAERMTKRMTEQLSLTKEQQEKIYQLSLDQAKQAAERAKLLKENGEKMRSERSKNRDEIEKILTPEQQIKWKEVKLERSKLAEKRRYSRQNDFKRKSRMSRKADSISSKNNLRKITPIMKEVKE